jgi:hypothetical protein
MLHIEHTVPAWYVRVLPKPTHKGISIPAAVYDYLAGEYEPIKVELFSKYGISSLTGFIVWRLRESIERHGKGESAGGTSPEQQPKAIFEQFYNALSEIKQYAEVTSCGVCGRKLAVHTSDDLETCAKMASQRQT